MATNLTGQKIQNKYTLTHLLGTGGMGSVYQAQDETLKRQVAIKIIHPSLLGQEQFKTRFLQEAQTAANLNHPCIVQIYDFNQEAHWLYMVMELFPAGNLKNYLQGFQQRGQVTPLADVLFLVARVAEALGYAYLQKGVVHRDIKPDNIMIKSLYQPEHVGEPAIRPVLSDFGLAKLTEGGLLQTEASKLMGTLQYISPEQLEGKKLDGRTDLYSLGIVLYELVTGQLPFNIRTVDEAFQSHRHGIPTAPHLIRTDIPPVVEDIITKAIAKDRNGRYQAGQEMADALHAAAQQVREQSSATSNTDLPADKANLLAQTARPEPDQLTIKQDGENDRVQPLDKSSFTLGRIHDNDIVFTDHTVSSHHARIQKTDDGWQVTDLQSTNGTFLGNAELSPHQPTNWPVGEKLAIGPFTLTWQKGKVPAVTPQPAPRVLAPPPPPKQQIEFVPEQELTHLSSVRLDPITVELKPGAQKVVQVHMHNESSRVEHFSIAVEGLPKAWIQLSEKSVQLLPNDETTFHFTIQITSQMAEAKTYPYRLVLRALADEREEGAAFGNVLIQPAPHFSAELNPQRVKNEGRCQVVLNNNGNTHEQFIVMARDTNEMVLFDQMTRRLAVPPGEEGYVNFDLKPVERPFYGNNKKSHPFQLEVSSSSGENKTQPGQLEVSPRMPKWLFVLVLAFFGLSIPFSMLSAKSIGDRAKATIIANITHTAEAQQTKEAVLSIDSTATATIESIQTATAVAIGTATAKASDSDGDGITNSEEEDLGTSSNNPDTDGDLLCDGEEVVFGTNPIVKDSDSDTVLDGNEVATCTNEVLEWQDENGETLKCYYKVEIENRTDPLCRHPNNRDTDNDLINDEEDPDSTQGPTATPTRELPPAPNQLPNASFEEDFRVYSEQFNNVMVPPPWFIKWADNIPNTLNPHTGNFFFQPESGSVSKQNLDESEQALFLLDGEQAMKIFKDDAPVYFTLYQPVTLDVPGTYRFEIWVFADAVSSYRSKGVKDYATDPLSAEVQLCIEGAEYDDQDWETAKIGNWDHKYIDFVVPALSTVIIFVSFRNRFELDNNGWFFDNWSLTKIADLGDSPDDLRSGQVCVLPP